jgi:hypothetical protein
MSIFSSLQNDVVYIERPSGDRSGPHKTAITSRGGFSASIFESGLDVEEGWKLPPER